MSDLLSAMSAAASGLRAQSVRLRISAENLANADTTAATPGGDPYRRKAPVFRAYFDREVGAETVKVAGAREDRSPFPEKYDPTHPGADARGYVKLSNVSALIEMADMREAVRGYSANTQVIKQVREMTLMTIDLLRGT